MFNVSTTSYAADESLAYKTFKEGMAAERHLRIYEARELYLKALEGTPENQGFLTHYAWFLSRYGFAEEALETFKRLLPLVDDNQKNSVVLGLAWSHQSLGQLDAALTYYKKRMALDTGDRRRALETVRWHLHEENRKKIEVLKQKIASGFDPVVHRRELAEVYIDQGKLDNVIRTASVLRDQNELDLKTHWYLARAQHWSGDLRQAEQTYVELDRRSPANAFLHVEWAEVRIADGRLAEAQALLENALKLYPGATAARSNLADVLARQHKDDAAMAMAETIPADGTNRLAGLMARARCRHFTGNIETARPIYARVLADYPFYADALWGMTETAIFTGHYAAARRTLNRWEEAPADPRLSRQLKHFRHDTAPAVTTQASYYSNSSDFSRTDAGLSGNWYLGAAWRLTTGYRFSGFFQSGFSDIYRNTGFLDVRKGITDRFELTGGLAGHAYDNGHGALDGTLGLSYQVSPSLSIHPLFRHMAVIDTTRAFENMAYSHTVSIGAVAMNLSADEFGGRIDYRPRPRLFFSGDVRYAEYSDDNQKWCTSAEAAYRLSIQPDWRIAYNYFYLDYRDPAPVYREAERRESAYYDPINFETHSLRLIFRDSGDQGRLNYGGEAALSYIPKGDGTGTYLSAFVSWRCDEDWTLRLDARGYYQNRGIDRYDTTGHFWADNLLLSIKYRF